MNRTFYLIAVIIALATMVSCKSQPQSAPLFQHTPPGDSLMLSSGDLTSLDAVLSAFPDDSLDYFHETTPESAAFYFPASDISEDPFVRDVQLYYNYAAVFNRVIHSYEWLCREAADMTGSRKDTLRWARQSCPTIPSAVLDGALPNSKARKEARRLIEAYRNFDGDRGPSRFNKAVDSYRATFQEMPSLVDLDGYDAFENRFWDWYDKKPVVAEIDTLVKMSIHRYENGNLSDAQWENLRRTIISEKDIDRRCILALEYVKYDREKGVPLLGDVLESGIYTKYLLEAWISWRANTQMLEGRSTYSIIANNYYDRLKVLCIDTMVRHYLRNRDENALWLLANLVNCEILHREGSLLGNEALDDTYALSSYMFIHPRLVER